MDRVLQRTEIATVRVLLRTEFASYRHNNNDVQPRPTGAALALWNLLSRQAVYDVRSREQTFWLGLLFVVTAVKNLQRQAFAKPKAKAKAKAKPKQSQRQSQAKTSKANANIQVTSQFRKANPGRERFNQQVQHITKIVRD